MPTEPAASCQGVVRIYFSGSGEVHALKGVDAVLPAGSLTTISGPSGSGKSTLLRILAAQDRPTAGSAQLAGQSLTGLSRRSLRQLRRRRVGYVFARPTENLLAHLDARQHLELAGRLRGLDRRAAAREGEQLLDRLGLAGRGGHRPSQLSGGEQQRLAFAQAVVGGPTLVVADEPTGELDEATTAELLDAVRSLTAAGTTVVLATHDPQAAAAADQVLHMRSGTIAAEQVDGRRLAIIDADGRLQLDEAVLARFPTRRVLVEADTDGHVRLRAPR